MEVAMARPENPNSVPANWQTLREGDVYRRLAEMVDRGEDGVLATVVTTQLSAPRHSGSKMIVHGDGSLTGSIGGGSAEALVITEAEKVRHSGECLTVPIDLAGGHGVCGGAMQVFLEPVLRTVPFIVVGAGHVGQAVVTVGRTLGFRFTVVDDRAELLAAAKVPGVCTILAAPESLPDQLEVPRRGAVVVCSRNHQLDGGYLEALLSMELRQQREFVFFGALGSRAKAAKLRKRVTAIPDYAARMGQVRLPVGIAIGAETPAEIALSILAEAQAVLRGIQPIRTEDGQVGYPLQGAGS
jgi:xanthine dehydrogenase accessory factor